MAASVNLSLSSSPAGATSSSTTPSSQQESNGAEPSETARVEEEEENQLQEQEQQQEEEQRASPRQLPRGPRDCAERGLSFCPPKPTGDPLVTPLGPYCANLQTSTANCGECGNDCEGTFDHPNVRDICTGGSCNWECQPGFVDCDLELSNGCEFQGDECPKVCEGNREEYCPSRNTCVCQEGLEHVKVCDNAGNCETRCAPICTQQRSSTGACCVRVGEEFGCPGEVVPPPDESCPPS